MTDRLDRLERAGLVVRRPDPKDRRGKLIVLTDPGKRLIDEAIGRHVANEERLLLSLTKDEQEDGCRVWAVSEHSPHRPERRLCANTGHSHRRRHRVKSTQGARSCSISERKRSARERSFIARVPSGVRRDAIANASIDFCGVACAGAPGMLPERASIASQHASIGEF
jgi:DNA-binding MarR family transcriptional regulator